MCVICLEETKDELELDCKHHFHVTCLQQHFKQECPLCRRPQEKVKVFGSKPSSNYTPAVTPTATLIAITEIEICYTFNDFDREFIRENPNNSYAVRVAKRRLRRGRMVTTLVGYDEDGFPL